nr:MAG TPA_asm: hypothetical protein [Bacteriophage sp.]
MGVMTNSLLILPYQKTPAERGLKMPRRIRVLF